MIKHMKWLAVMAALWALFGCYPAPKAAYYRATIVTTEGIAKDGRPYTLSEIQVHKTTEEPAKWVK